MILALTLTERMARAAATTVPRPDPRQLMLVKDPDPRPFLKWVGGKTQLLDQLQPLLPKTFRRYFEPFVGGAALFFDLRAKERLENEIVLSDVNDELINCYAVIQNNVEALIEELRKHRYESDYYYRVREQKRAGLSEVASAARTIFLNKTGYNGLYRVNRSGQFNVPFGKFTNPAICDAENLRACARALRDVTLTHGDYSSVLEHAKKGDFVYFDPPYDPVTTTANFASYTADGFSPDDQRALADTARSLVAKGCKVMLSNSDTPFIRSIYKGFRVERVKCPRAINSNAAKRGDVDELIITGGY